MSIRQSAKRVLSDKIIEEETTEKKKKSKVDKISDILGVESISFSRIAKERSKINRALLRQVYSPISVSKDPIAKYTKIREVSTRKTGKVRPEPVYFFEVHKLFRKRRKGL